jgi:ADP-ribose pyrophosphatase
MSEIKYDGKYIQVVKEDHWEYVTRKGRKGAVIIVPVLDKSLVCISEYRIPLGKRELGLPAGLMGDLPGHENEDLIDAAVRELMEETGYFPGTMKVLAESMPSSSGLTDEVFSLLLAEDIKKVGEGGGDETEDIKVVNIPLRGIANTIKKDYADHAISPKLYMALYFLKELGYEV